LFSRKDDFVKIKQKEGYNLQGKERGLRGVQPCWDLNLGFPVPRNVRK
jgi:hypothetical protein